MIQVTNDSTPARRRSKRTTTTFGRLYEARKKWQKIEFLTYRVFTAVLWCLSSTSGGLSLLASLPEHHSTTSRSSAAAGLPLLTIVKNLNVLFFPTYPSCPPLGVLT
jgi:hypothetical protein